MIGKTRLRPGFPFAGVLRPGSAQFVAVCLKGGQEGTHLWTTTESVKRLSEFSAWPGIWARWATNSAQAPCPLPCFNWRRS